MFIFGVTFILSLVLLSAYIYFGKKYNISTQQIRDDGPVEHLKTKQNTLTMGGLFVILSILPFYQGIELLPLLLFAGIGLFDDILKVHYKNLNAKFKLVFKRGLKERSKFLLQIIVGLIAALFLDPAIPFCSDLPYLLDLAWAILFLIGVSNAVNLTDGLDGLITFPLILCFAFYYLVFGYIIALLAAIALIPFLFFNYNPAKVFMGDVGALGFGALLAYLALDSYTELYLIPLGLFFVIDTLSVILQVGYYKKTKKRLFLMAPLHHHFEKKGYSEKLIVWFVWLVQFLITSSLYVFLT